MKVYAISDLHLSLSGEKPMDIFGEKWDGYLEKIEKDWNDKVADGDVVLICGDVSWAMKLTDALEDLRALACLPGKKVFIRGNHDYWWNGITKLRDSAPDDSFVFLQTDAVKIGEFVIVGSRGWTCPGSVDYTDQDQKLYLREAERFRLAFRSVEGLKQDGDKLIALMHYPPVNLKREDSLFSQLFEQNGVDDVVFGHLDGAVYFPLRCEKNGVKYHLTSCDKTNFSLVKIY
jgi:predicted phosphohydrolase